MLYWSVWWRTSSSWTPWCGVSWLYPGIEMHRKWTGVDATEARAAVALFCGKAGSSLLQKPLSTHYQLLQEDHFTSGMSAASIE